MWVSVCTSLAKSNPVATVFSNVIVSLASVTVFASFSMHLFSPGFCVPCLMVLLRH